MTVIENFVFSKGINYTYIASSQNKFVLSNLPIAVSFSKCEKILCFLYKNKKASFMKINVSRSQKVDLVSFYFLFYFLFHFFLLFDLFLEL